MADPMKIRAALKGDMVEVRVLMSHIMETGQRKDAAGAVIPGHFIQSITGTCNGKSVLNGSFGPSISANPYLQFGFKGGAKGDKVIVSWTDNKGDKRTDEGVIS